MGRFLVVLVLAYETDVDHGQRSCAKKFAQQEIFIEAETEALIIVGEETMVEGEFPAILLCRSVFGSADSVFPLIAAVEVRSLHDAATGESEHTGTKGGKTLHEVATQTMDVVGREEGDMLQIDRIFRTAQIDPELPLQDCSVGTQVDFIFFPFGT